MPLLKSNFKKKSFTGKLILTLTAVYLKLFLIWFSVKFLLMYEAHFCISAQHWFHGGVEWSYTTLL